MQEYPAIPRLASKLRTIADAQEKTIGEVVAEIATGTLDLDPETKGLWIEVQSLMPIVVKKYRRLVYRLINHFKEAMPKHRVQREDMYQEGMTALCHAVYGYNGETKFLTFAYICVKRKLHLFVNQGIINIPLAINQLLCQLKEVAKEEKISWLEVADRMQIDHQTRSRLIAADFWIVLVSETDVDEWYAIPERRAKPKSVKNLLDALQWLIDNEPLTKLQKAIVQGFLDGNTKFTGVARRTPRDDGKGFYSGAAGSLAIKAIVNKLAKQFRWISDDLRAEQGLPPLSDEQWLRNKKRKKSGRKKKRRSSGGNSQQGSTGTEST